MEGAPRLDRKTLVDNRKLLDDLIKRRFIYFQSAQIYGGCAGLYDFGPVGCAVKNNLEQFWREHFVLEEDMLEVNTTCVTPSVVLENSGHVARFCDLLVKDVKTGQGFRADKLLAEWIEKKLQKDKIKPEESERLNKMLVNVDNFTREELTELFRKNEIKSPDTGNVLSDPEPFNLMFQTQIGSSVANVGFLRPETAQGMFVNFNKLLEYNGHRLPFAAAQIGLGFRNQIAPRGGLLRVREFQMAEIEHFVDPLNKQHPRFKQYAKLRLPLYSAKAQESMASCEWIEAGRAVELKIVDNQTLGYFLCRIFLFLKECGINTEHHLRFRQHMSNEMAHYAADCWDAEIQMASGWVECVGCADRSAFDLTKHSQGSGSKLVAARKFKNPRQQLQTIITFNRQAIGKEFKKNAQPIIAHLQSLDEGKKAVLFAEWTQKKQFTLTLAEGAFPLTENHVKCEQQMVNITEEKFTPSVIEPSFGLGRILTAIFEHSFRARDEKRTYLLLKPRIAPVKVSILPLQYDERFKPIIDDIRARLKRCLITCKVDDSGQSIGKRYARTDEIGIPFGVTVDYQTIDTYTVTLRQLYTMKQIRIPVVQLDRILTSLSNQTDTWFNVCQKFPAYDPKETQ